MWRTENVSSLESLSPATPGESQVLYTLIRDEMDVLFPTRPAAVRQMSLIAVRHLQGEGQRVLIRGPRGSSTGAFVRALVKVLDLPFVEIDAGALAETNWSGSDLPFFLEQLRSDLASRYSLFKAPALAERACILVSHLDRARLATAYGTAPNQEHRIGKQAALAQLMQAGPIAVARGSGTGFVWDGNRALIIATGEFRGLPPGFLSSSDLQSWGMLADLADPIASAVLISTDLPSASEVEWMLRARLGEMEMRFVQFGYRLEVEEQVIRYISRVIADGQYGGGVEAGMSWIAAAAESALVGLLDRCARPGTVWVLARDDMSLPDPPRGVWRE